MENATNLFSYEINGSRLAVQVATSVTKKGTLRYRKAYGVGGDPEGARGSDIHYRKLNAFANSLSEITESEWELKDLVFLMDPREYYGRITDGEHELIYQYITTKAPGSGQQYMFSPLLSKTRIAMGHLEPGLAGLMIKHKMNMDYNKIRWQDREIMIDLLTQGVNPDLLESTMQLMR